MNTVTNKTATATTENMKPKSMTKNYIAVTVGILATMGFAILFFLTTIPVQASAPVISPAAPVELVEEEPEAIPDEVEPELVEVNGIISDDPEIQRLYDLANNRPDNYDTMTLEEAVEYGYLTPEDAAKVVQ